MVAWHVQTDAIGRRMQDTCDRIIANLARVIAIVQAIEAKTARVETRLPREESLPADVPLHQRGFGVPPPAAKSLEGQRHACRFAPIQARSVRCSDLPADVPLHQRGFGVMDTGATP